MFEHEAHESGLSSLFHGWMCEFPDMLGTIAGTLSWLIVHRCMMEKSLGEARLNGLGAARMTGFEVAYPMSRACSPGFYAVEPCRPSPRLPYSQGMLDKMHGILE